MLKRMLCCLLCIDMLAAVLPCAIAKGGEEFARAAECGFVTEEMDGLFCAISSNAYASSVCSALTLLRTVQNFT